MGKNQSIYDEDMEKSLACTMLFLNWQCNVQKFTHTKFPMHK